VNRALVLGKFYPPHAGHLALIEYALSIRDSVTVLMYGSPFDTFSVADRADCVRSSLPDLGIDPSRVDIHIGKDITPFDLDNEAVWSSHAAIFLTSMDRYGPVDVLVSSESYGDELASRLGIESQLFDISRSKLSISATQWRSNPIGSWEHLAPGTKRLLTTHVVFIGAESTGTTTVSELVSRELRSRGGAWSGTNLVTEYGRDVTESKLADGDAEQLSAEWLPADFEHIAQTQAANQTLAGNGQSPVLICDTDAFATTIWEHRYLGDLAQLDVSGFRTGDLYLATDHIGVPFVQDGTRDGEHIRADMTRWFCDALEESARPWAFLSGTVEARVNLAVRTIDALVKQRLTFIDTI